MCIIFRRLGWAQTRYYWACLWWSLSFSLSLFSVGTVVIASLSLAKSRGLYLIQIFGNSTLYWKLWVEKKFRFCKPLKDRLIWVCLEVLLTKCGPWRSKTDSLSLTHTHIEIHSQHSHVHKNCVAGGEVKHPVRDVKEEGEQWAGHNCWNGWHQLQSSQ